jgi:hypothetical protein
MHTPESLTLSPRPAGSTRDCLRTQSWACEGRWLDGGQGVAVAGREHVAIDVDGRQLSPEVNLHGPLPDNVTGLPVRVTFYQGVTVHIEGGDLNFDTSAAPVDHVDELRTAGLFLVIGGTLIMGVNALIRLARRADFG